MKESNMIDQAIFALPPFEWRPRNSLACVVNLSVLVNCVFLLNAQESKPLFDSSGGHLVAIGKWRASSPMDVLAKHTVEIRCFFDIRECFEAKAEIAGGEPQASLQEYRVIEWNNDGIVAEDNSAICTTARLIINFQAQSVTAIDTPKRGAKGLPLADGKNARQLADYTRTYTLVNRSKTE